MLASSLTQLLCSGGSNVYNNIAKSIKCMVKDSYMCAFQTVVSSGEVTNLSV